MRTKELGDHFTHHQPAVNKGIEQANNYHLPISGWLKGESKRTKELEDNFYSSPMSSKQRN
jgi:hypothetical protein